MWPSGEVKVCKTCYGGSNPSMTSMEVFSTGKKYQVHSIKYQDWCFYLTHRKVGIQTKD